MSLNGKRPTSTLRQQASRENGAKSKGPATEFGKTNSRKNAMKHGLLSSVVLLEEVEFRRELDVLVESLYDDLKPEGAIEELLVDEIAVCFWRLRRALQSEAGHVQSNMAREVGNLVARIMKTANDIRCTTLSRDPASAVDIERALEFQASSHGIRAAQNYLRESLTDEVCGTDLECTQRVENAIKTLESAVESVAELESREASHLVHSLYLPTAAESDKILRYETTIKRGLFRTMDQLERLQRRRKGEYVPPPVKVGIQQEG